MDVAIRFHTPEELEEEEDEFKPKMADGENPNDLVNRWLMRGDERELMEARITHQEDNVNIEIENVRMNFEGIAVMESTGDEIWLENCPWYDYRFLGAAFESVGGVGGGEIFVPMLTLIIGFDPKSSTAISKRMIMGDVGATVYYNLKLRHPTLDLPIIYYDLARLIEPMLMLGISIGVAFNVIFADWMESQLSPRQKCTRSVVSEARHLINRVFHEDGCGHCFRSEELEEEDDEFKIFF
ncbi:hypothetical protein Scep_022971 [Stephania cephalantha]|uniref:Uncharacterized protein n=1 Tax=Stephania cephalantha TaxID=152367 RepID=A0AAP0FD13_9MAGN